MIGYALRRYGAKVALVLVVVDLVLAYLVGSRLVEWELDQIRDQWNAP